MNKKVPKEITWWDIIGVTADIQTSFTENYKELVDKYNWKLPDARVQVFYNNMDLAANARLNIGLIGFAVNEGIDKEWWAKWLGYSPEAFKKIPDFDTYIKDKCRQYTHRVQEQLMINTNIYIEGFLRNLSRQFSINENELWKIKKRLLEEKLGLTKEELKPITVYQHLRNSLHNKGVHYNEKYPKEQFEINGYEYYFEHNKVVMTSWNHIKELIVANSELLFKIINNPKVNSLPSFDEKNVVVIKD